MADSNLPIDIHTNKLLDWLISRRHCKKDYLKALESIRNQIKDALQDMPQIEEVEQLLKENVFDYYVCKKVIEILKKTDKSSKNIFGQYTSKRLHDWQDIVKLYEKDNVFLSEEAQTLIRNVTYEIPSLKKLQTKYEQQISDLERLVETTRKQSKSYLLEYHNSCKKLGIEGDNVKQELYTQLETLPNKLTNLSTEIQKLIPVCTYYKSFIYFVSQNEIECLPMLHYLLAKGNTTYYEYRTGNAPEVIEEFKFGCQSPSIMDDVFTTNNEDDNMIDFGDDDGTTTTSSTNGDFVKLEQEDLSNEINWDITADDNDQEKEKSLSIEEKVGQDVQGKVAKGKDAHSVLLLAELRNKFINELIEIEFFLNERIHEMESDHMLASYLFQSAPSVIQLTTVDGLREMLVDVVQTRELFESSALKVLYYMKDSPKYIDNVYKKVSHLKKLSSKSTQKADNLEQKRLALLNELSKMGPQIESYFGQTKLIQKRIEECLSKKYDNRPVNIMGGVQAL